MALFKIEKGSSSNLKSNRQNTNEGYCYFTTDEGKMYIDIKTGINTSNDPSFRVALNAEKADKLNNINTTENIPVYFKNGLPVEVTKNYLELDSANKALIQDVYFTNIHGNLNGNAKSADKLNTNAGDSNTPVYFLNGVPAACTSLDLNTSGSARKLAEANGGYLEYIFDNDAQVGGIYARNSNKKNRWSLISSTTAGPGNLVCHWYDENGTWAGQGTLITNKTIDKYALPFRPNENSTLIPSGANLNSTDYLEIGTYYATTSQHTAASPITNCPVPAATGFIMTVQCPDSKSNTIDGTWIRRIRKIISGTGIEYIQNVYSGSTAGNFTYTAWRQCLTTGDKYAGSASSGGPATSAVKLNTARTISLTGDVTGSGTFDGSGDLSITTTVADNSHSHSYLPLSGGAMTGRITSIYGTPASSIGNMYTTAAIQIRENNAVGNAQSDILYAPTLGFHWSGKVACNLSLHSDGALYLYNSGGNLSPFKAGSVYGAVWNDYAEYRTQKEEIKPGYCVASSDNGQVYKTTEKFQACDGIVSDTFGFAIGETDECKTPLAVAGRVLAYCEGDRCSYHSGDAVCAGPDGKVVKMTREEIREWPDRIIGIVSEIPEYEIWGSGNVAVNGRIWIKVK